MHAESETRTLRARAIGTAPKRNQFFVLDLPAKVPYLVETGFMRLESQKQKKVGSKRRGLVST